MTLLCEFVLRLAFGLAAGMLLVPARLVTSGYFRNHLYVTMGLALLAGLLARTGHRSAFAPAMAAAALSYVGSLCWLYEKPRAGKIALALVAAASLLGAALVAQGAIRSNPHAAWHYAHVLTSGGLLGVTMAAMLLGHWYLNAPGMKLEPLRKLLVAMAVALAFHATVCAYGVWQELALREPTTQFWLFLALRWSFGLAGVAALIWMAWRTLDVPNTQAATGILYVAVIGTFVGETMSLLLSAESTFPL
jgi:hypothetical protein